MPRLVLLLLQPEQAAPQSVPPAPGMINLVHLPVNWHPPGLMLIRLEQAQRQNVPSAHLVDLREQVVQQHVSPARLVHTLNTPAVPSVTMPRLVLLWLQPEQAPLPNVPPAHGIIKLVHLSVIHANSAILLLKAAALPVK